MNRRSRDPVGGRGYLARTPPIPSEISFRPQRTETCCNDSVTDLDLHKSESSEAFENSDAAIIPEPGEDRPRASIVETENEELVALKAKCARLQSELDVERDRAGNKEVAFALLARKYDENLNEKSRLQAKFLNLQTENNQQSLHMRIPTREIELVSTSNTSDFSRDCSDNESTFVSSALRRPMYKVCKSPVRQQLDDTNHVPKMSDDLASSVQCDALGRCSVHPYVQIRRKSIRTGQWKELFQSCPLCAMDGRGGRSSVSGGSSVCSAASSSGGGYSASTGGIDRSVRSGYGSSSSSGDSDSLDGSRRSRVSFHDGMEDEADDIKRNVAALRSLPYHGSDDRSPSGSLSGLAGLPDAGGGRGGGIVDPSSTAGGGGSVVSTGARSALKRPKYKVCVSLMRQQLDDSNRVPKMSEDLDIDVDSDDEDGHDKDVIVPRPGLDDMEGIHGEREEEKEGEIEEDEEPPADLHETRRTDNSHETKLNEIDEIRMELEENLMLFENELADREDNIDNLTREMDRLSSENETLNRNVLDLSSAKMECMDKIRELKEELSDADSAIDDAKAAIETLLDERKAADGRIQDLRSERASAEEAAESVRKQMIALRKEQEAKFFKAQADNEVLRMEKREASKRVTGLEDQIAQAETAICDAKAALKKMLEKKNEASRRMKSLEEEYSHAKSTIDTLTKSMSHSREEYEAKIESLMSGLATAREVHASRSSASTATGEELRLVRSESRSTYSNCQNSGNDAGDTVGGADCRRGSVGSSHSSSKSARPTRSRRESKQPQRSAGIRTPTMIEPEAVRPDPEGFPCGHSRSSQDSRAGQTRGGGRQLDAVSPSGDVTARADGVVRNNAQPGAVSPPPCLENNMVIIAPANFKDDVSAMSIMGSVSKPPPPPAQGGLRMSNICEEDESGGEHDDDYRGRIDSNEYGRKGRGVRYPHVRLRKKKLFSLGWRVLMSAFPDNCVYKLKRIRLVEEGKRKASKRPPAPREAVNQQQQPPQAPPSRPGQGSCRSFHHYEQQEQRQGRQGSGRSGSSFHVDAGPSSSRRPSQRAGEPSSRHRSSSHQQRYSLASNQSSLLQQPPPPPKRSPSVTPGSRSLVPWSAGSVVDTASLTEALSDSSNKAPSARDQGRKTMHVRKMMHTDRATGRTGRYTGCVDESFVPDGEGALTHDDGSVLEGGWRDGRLISSGPVAWRQPSGGGGGQRTMSGSPIRTPREPSRDRHNGAHVSQAASPGRLRSHSRTAGVQEWSASRSSTAGRHHQLHPVAIVEICRELRGL